jgi:hypothetical protein
MSDIHQYESVGATCKNHDLIADWAAEKLRRQGYLFAFSNLTSASHREKPDVLAFNHKGTSLLIEVKVSRADFLADKKKPWRENPEKGIGETRVYLTPKGLLTHEEIPYGWQLWEVHGEKRPFIKIIKGYKSSGQREPINATHNELGHFKRKKFNKKIEASWLLKFMKRAFQDGVNVEQYANNFQRTQLG